MERERMAVHGTSTNILLGCTFSQMKEMAQEKDSLMTFHNPSDSGKNNGERQVKIRQLLKLCHRMLEVQRSKTGFTNKIYSRLQCYSWDQI